MSKEVLIIDMQSSCEECILRNEGACFPVSKQTSICGVYYTMKEGRRPDWCPLKPMPEKKVLSGDITNIQKMGKELLDIGYNAFIDELLGDKE